MKTWTIVLNLLVAFAAVAAAADPPLYPLWDTTKPLPKAAELPRLTGVDFYVIKPYEFDKDGFRFLHGVALAWHKGRLYASFGHNKGGENTDTEEARFSTSDDGGKTWNAVATMDAGDEPGVGVSHGVFLSLKGRLWAFHGAYTGTMQDVHTRCYLLDDSNGTWQQQRHRHRGWILAAWRTAAHDRWELDHVRRPRGPRQPRRCCDQSWR